MCFVALCRLNDMSQFLKNIIKTKIAHRCLPLKVNQLSKFLVEIENIYINYNYFLEHPSAKVKFIRMPQQRLTQSTRSNCSEI